MNKDKLSNEILWGRVYIVAMTVYIMLPILIFFGSWLKLYIAIPSVIVILFGAFTIIKNNWNNKFEVEGKHIIATLIVVLALIIVFVYFSGIGGYVAQKRDHNWRNAMFDVLVECKWPVLTDVLYEDEHIARNGMVYYIGYWMPAAVFGKVFGLEAGYFFQFVWAILGVYLTYLSISYYIKKIAVWPFLVFIFFSGLDIVGSIIFTNCSLSNWTKQIEWWAYNYQYSSQYTQLSWVFNQAIYGWLIFLFLINQKNTRTLIPIWACGLIESTFPFVGMIPYLAFIVIRNAISDYKKNKKIKEVICNMLTVSNVVVGGVIGIISFIYMKNNFASHTVYDSFSGLEVVEGGAQVTQVAAKVAIYSICESLIDLFSDVLVFLLIEVGIYMFLIGKENLKKPLFWITVGTLMICPFISVGGSADFVMRASIPALLMLLIMVIQSLMSNAQSKLKVKTCILILVLVIGAVTPLHELVGTINDTAIAYEKYGEIEKKSVGGIVRTYTGNFSGATEGSFFFTYLAKEVDEVDLYDVNGKKVD